MAKKSGTFSLSIKESVPTLPNKDVGEQEDFPRFYSEMTPTTIDVAYGGGVIRGFSYSLSGYAGTGKTTLCLQHQSRVVKYHKEYLDEEVKCLYITNEQSVDDLNHMCAKLDIDNVYLAHMYNLSTILWRLS